VHLYNGNLFSSSSGGGNPALPGGRAGYLVLENFIDPNDPSQGGFERPVGVAQGIDPQEADQRFGSLRLLSANDTGEPAPATRVSTTMTGWAAGYLEQESGSGINLLPFNSGAGADNPGNSQSPGDVAFQAANLSVTTDEDKNRAAASITSGGTTLDLGGLSSDPERPSAYVDGERFAAAIATDDRQVGLVSDGFVDDHAALSDIPEYEHVKWGFFFGDIITAEGRREHVHLGSWAAGVPGDITGVRGTASYVGHAIGNVYNDGAYYTAVGSYTNTWDFDRRVGSVGMDFDDRSYSGSTAITTNPSFVGTLNAGDRAGGLSGQFIRGGGDPVAGVVGQFSVQSVNDNAGVYRGVGTFGAEKQ
jgi:hypothetical protein